MLLVSDETAPPLPLTDSLAKEYKVGDIVEFTLGYGGMLKTATSPYVEKVYK